MTVSTSSSMPSLTASNATLAGSAPSRSDRTTVAPTREPQVCSWSAAAARNVSAAPSSTVRPSPISTRASLPQVVVLPVPLTPTTAAPRDGPRARLPAATGPGPARWPRSAGPAAATARPRVPAAGHLDLGPQLLDQLPGRGDAHVGGDQRVLDLLPGLVVERGPATAGRAAPRRTRTATGPAGRAAGPSGRPTAAAISISGAAGSATASVARSGRPPGAGALGRHPRRAPPVAGGFGGRRRGRRPARVADETSR